MEDLDSIRLRPICAGRAVVCAEGISNHSVHVHAVSRQQTCRQLRTPPPAAPQLPYRTPRGDNRPHAQPPQEVGILRVRLIETCLIWTRCSWRGRRTQGRIDIQCEGQKLCADQVAPPSKRMRRPVRSCRRSPSGAGAAHPAAAAPTRSPRSCRIGGRDDGLPPGGRGSWSFATACCRELLRRTHWRNLRCSETRRSR
eukprot:COSAG01_NODE_10092_length_2252_cov_2.119368_1_plen_198_part_00